MCSWRGFATIDGQYSYFNGKQNALLKNLNISTDAPYFSSLYYDGQYLFWSKYSEKPELHRADRLGLRGYGRCVPAGHLRN